jgi:hypothetical protein
MTNAAVERFNRVPQFEMRHYSEDALISYWI